MFTATFGVANICGNPRMPSSLTDKHRHWVDEDLAKLAGLGADVTGAVEIDHPDYRRLFKETFTRKGQRVYNLAESESPLATSLAVRRTWIRKLHDGVARVTPARKNAYTRLDEIAEPVLVIVKHPVSGAFRKAPTFRQRLRRRLWMDDQQITTRRINRAHRNGVNVVVLTDANTVHEPRYHHSQIVANHKGLMWILVCPAPNTHVDVSHVRSIPTSQLHTDHPMLAATLTFTRRAK